MEHIRKVSFDVPIAESSWVALRILPAAHTNPIFVMVGKKPICASRASAQWDLDAVHQAWTQKAPRISPASKWRHVRHTITLKESTSSC